MVEIAIMGHGTVGSGVVEVLTRHEATITKRAKEEIRINTFWTCASFRTVRLRIDLQNR